MYKDDVVFKVMGDNVYLISDETCYGRNTVAEINRQLHYLGDEPPTIATAVFIWQELNSKLLSSDELHQVMLDNNLISAAI